MVPLEQTLLIDGAQRPAKRALTSKKSFIAVRKKRHTIVNLCYLLIIAPTEVVLWVSSAYSDRVEKTITDRRQTPRVLNLLAAFSFLGCNI